jgi:hypothetical protein
LVSFQSNLAIPKLTGPLGAASPHLRIDLPILARSSRDYRKNSPLFKPV